MIAPAVETTPFHFWRLEFIFIHLIGALPLGRISQSSWRHAAGAFPVGHFGLVPSGGRAVWVHCWLCCRWGRKRCGGRSGGRDGAPVALWTTSPVVGGRRPWPVRLGTRTASGLVSVIRILTLMALFLLVGQALPIVFDFVRLLLPLLPNDFGNLGVRKVGVLRNNLSLVMLTIEDEGCNSVSPGSIVWRAAVATSKVAQIELFGSSRRMRRGHR